MHKFSNWKKFKAGILVTIVGTINLYNEKPEIILSEEKQIKVI